MTRLERPSCNCHFGLSSWPTGTLKHDSHRRKTQTPALSLFE